jgi:RimJ/RimL family protein N-acetyltransferase
VKCAEKPGQSLTGEEGKRNMELRFVDVYNSRPYRELYDLLLERKEWQSISHEKMPNYGEHTIFVETMPYEHWYGIYDKDTFVGSIYIGKENNIGLFLKEGYSRKGIGKAALLQIMKMHPLPYYKANIAPMNSNSVAFFSNFGFKYYSTLLEEIDINGKDQRIIIQYTYKFIPASSVQS